MKYNITELEELVSKCDDATEHLEDLKENIKSLVDEISNERTPKVMDLFDEILSFDIDNFGSKVESDLENYKKSIQEVIDNATEVDSNLIKK